MSDDDFKEEIRDFHEGVIDSLFDMAGSGEEFDDIEFDLYAQHSHEWDDLKKFIPSILVSSAGGMLPYQMEGWVKGYPFYLREEWGGAELRIAEKREDVYLGPFLWTSSASTPEDGVPREDLIELITSLFKSLETAPFRYGFKGRRIEFIDAGDGYTLPISTLEEETYYGWGSTPEEAFQNTKLAPRSLENRELMAAVDELRDISPIPVIVDDRVIPKMPDWFS